MPQPLFKSEPLQSGSALPRLPYPLRGIYIRKVQLLSPGIKASRFRITSTYVSHQRVRMDTIQSSDQSYITGGPMTFTRADPAIFVRLLSVLRHPTPVFGYVPISQEWRYLSCSGVSLSISTPMNPRFYTSERSKNHLHRALHMK